MPDILNAYQSDGGAYASPQPTAGSAAPPVAYPQYQQFSTAPSAFCPSQFSYHHPQAQQFVPPNTFAPAPITLPSPQRFASAPPYQIPWTWQLPQSVPLQPQVQSPVAVQQPSSTVTRTAPTFTSYVPPGQRSGNGACYTLPTSLIPRIPDLVSASASPKGTSFVPVTPASQQSFTVPVAKTSPPKVVVDPVFSRLHCSACLTSASQASKEDLTEGGDEAEMPKNGEEEEQIPEMYWTIICKVCNKGDNEDNLLICDKCASLRYLFIDR